MAPFVCGWCGIVGSDAPANNRRYCSKLCKGAATGAYWHPMEEDVVAWTSDFPHAPSSGRLRFFISRIERGTHCWTWRGTVEQTGYGVSAWGGKHVRVHRVSYEMATGFKAPDGSHVHHRCRNRACVNPAHLALIAPAEHSRWHAFQRARRKLKAAA